MPVDSQFKTSLKVYCERVDHHLNLWLPEPAGPEARLQEAMRYSVVGGGGKRVRPILVYAAGQALNVEPEQLDACACAVEIIHAYSLIHDDLPAMDDDDLRRGRPTCHVAFDDATAILAGDALQAFAFEVLASDSAMQTSAGNRIEMIKLLAQASGSVGMAGGQAIDLGAVGKSLVLEELENMHLLKTGALIRASVLLGAMCSPNIQAAKLEALDTYARCVGLAFQIHDDVLDVTADTETLGKPQGSDEQQNKPTYPALLGIEGARERALDLHKRAIKALESFDDSADVLRQLSAYIIERGH
ncbi:MAG: (2E,6E)-farnesyl diphosphate synthase [endosymbiont of Galathealinum brachiosum]|uniref:(2E,6E)-farnesyl diphosphate synthase n=1 Tax=endosymbiont of Galathealinum brachiosum TaxID=2200906 RepID=A0A370D8N4_9GAMM|nr:MAG: (2E,6E)-farnesyl diphosphate synthase [endosymbiont of Galathealinum brachiosum]